MIGATRAVQGDEIAIGLGQHFRALARRDRRHRLTHVAADASLAVRDDVQQEMLGACGHAIGFMAAFACGAEVGDEREAEFAHRAEVAVAEPIELIRTVDHSHLHPAAVGRAVAADVAQIGDRLQVKPAVGDDQRRAAIGNEREEPALAGSKAGNADTARRIALPHRLRPVAHRGIGARIHHHSARARRGPVDRAIRRYAGGGEGNDARLFGNRAGDRPPVGGRACRQCQDQGGRKDRPPHPMIVIPHFQIPSCAQPRCDEILPPSTTSSAAVI